MTGAHCLRNLIWHFHICNTRFASGATNDTYIENANYYASLLLKSDSCNDKCNEYFYYKDKECIRIKIREFVKAWVDSHGVVIR